MEKVCEVPHCENKENATCMFDNTNITCIKCNHFTCSKCCEQIWKGEWNGEQFYKPKFVFNDLKHEVWQCPFCRASFDRILPAN